jgi:hypothetical protein
MVPDQPVRDPPLPVGESMRPASLPHEFLVHGIRDYEFSQDVMQEVKTSQAGKGDNWSSIGNNHGQSRRISCASSRFTSSGFIRIAGTR